MQKLLTVFKQPKPIIAMLHLKGDSPEDIFSRALREFEIYRENGVDAVMVETYFGSYPDAVKMLSWLKENAGGMPYGVNCLNVDAMSFELAREYGCSFVQADSVVGHVKPRDEASLQAFFDTFRGYCPEAFLMGGVRFKYQPVLSQLSLEEDLKTAKNRCDGVCVTQDATGQETSIERIKEFREGLGKFPLIICAGVNSENVKEQLSIADGAVVGSYFKDNFRDNGDVDPSHVRELMNKVKELRKELNL